MLLSVVVGGGFAGRPPASLTVQGDGSLVATAGGPSGEPVPDGPIPDEDLVELRTLVESDAFLDLPARTFDQSTPDAFTYTFVTERHIVNAQDGDLPPPLGEVLGIIGPWMPER
jgi:hypothetical protein